VALQIIRELLFYFVAGVRMYTTECVVLLWCYFILSPMCIPPLVSNVGVDPYRTEGHVLYYLDWETLLRMPPPEYMSSNSSNYRKISSVQHFSQLILRKIITVHFLPPDVTF